MKRFALSSRGRQICGLFFAIGFYGGAPAHSATQSYECPAYVSPSGVATGDLPATWKAYVQPAKLKVVSAGLSDGEPSDMAFLKPYETKLHGNRSSVIWKLEGEYPKGVWLSCAYEGDFVALARPLPNDIAECVVEYEKTSAKGMKIDSITCR